MGCTDDNFAENWAAYKNWLTAQNVLAGIQLKEETMTQRCPYCQSEVSDDNQVFLVEKLLKWVEQQGGWYIFESSRYEHAAGRGIVLPSGETITIVDLKTSYDPGDVGGDSYGESPLSQGSTFETYIIFKVGDAYYKKTGTGDSYGEVSWDGDLKAVKATTKTVLVFE